jgi:thymidine kinase
MQEFHLKGIELFFFFHLRNQFLEFGHIFFKDFNDFFIFHSLPAIVFIDYFCKNTNLISYSSEGFMFIEKDVNSHKRQGSIETITGSMFSGKTEELIRRLKRAQFARQKVEIFKPVTDIRYSETHVVSHDENTIRSSSVENSSNILLLSGNVDVVGIDEAQFFDKGLVDVVQQLANMGIRVIVAGLDMDFKGMPFGPMPGILAISDHVTKVHAICVRCGSIAQFSHRLSDKTQVVLLGEKDSYEPLCRRCYLQASGR